MKSPLFLIEIPTHFQRPVRFRMVEAGAVASRDRDFRFVKSGFLAVPHLSASLYQALTDDDPGLPIEALRRISIVDPELVEDDLLPTPSLHPERVEFRRWLSAAAKQPAELWVRHLPLFLRATIRDMAGEGTAAGSVILVPDCAVAAAVRSNGSLAVSGFHDAATLPVEIIDRQERPADPPLEPLMLLGDADIARGGFVTRLEALLADIALDVQDKGDVEGVAFSPGRFAGALALSLDALGNPDERDSGRYEFPVIVGDYSDLSDTFTFVAATVSLSTDDTAPALRARHHAPYSVERAKLSPGFFELITDHLKSDTIEPRHWQALIDAANHNATPIVLFDANGGLIRSGDPRIAAIAPETSHLIKEETVIDLFRGLVKKSLFDLQKGSLKGLSKVLDALSEDRDRHPDGGDEGAKNDLQEVTDLINQMPEQDHSEGEIVPSSEAGPDADAVQEPADDEDIEDEFLGDAGGDEGGDDGDVEANIDDPPDQDDEADEDQKGGDAAGDAGLLPEPREGQRLADGPLDESANSPVVRDKLRWRQVDLGPREREVFDNILKHERSLRDRQIAPEDMKRSDRHMAILEAFVLIVAAPADFWRGREDQLPAEAHNDAEFIQERWSRNAVVRAIAVLVCEMTVEAKWNLDRADLTTGRMKTALKRAEQMLASAYKRMNIVSESANAGGGNAP